LKTNPFREILLFVHCLDESPSTNRRVLDYHNYLIAAKIQPTYLSYTPPRFYHYWFNGNFSGSISPFQIIKSLLHYGSGFFIIILRWVSLIRLLFVAPKFQAIFIQWITPPPFYIYLLKLRNSNIIFDFDDAVFLRKPKSSKTLVKVSSLVFAGSHYNFDYAFQYNDNTKFLPTPVPLERFKRKNQYSHQQGIIIGWIGSVSTLPNLGMIADALDNVAKKFPDVVLRIIGSRNREDLLPDFNEIDIEIIPQIPYAQVPDYIKELDIGIMPLENNNWEKGKCLGKTLEYMASGVPSVISKVGENIYAVEDNVNGFLAEKQDEWTEKLSILVKDSELRRRLGLAGLKMVEKKYSTKVCSKVLIDGLKKTCISNNAE
jgi:glycosyltransferase involved in cell wall biosynthesis